MGVKERLKQFVSYLNISEREFCRSVGVGSAYISSIKKSIKADKLGAITAQYPQLNPVWLIRGEGEMLLSALQSGQPPVTTSAAPAGDVPPSAVLAKLLEEVQSEKARLLSIIESQQRTIETLAEQNKKANAQTGADAGCAVAG